MNNITPNCIDIATNCIIKAFEGCKLVPYLCPAGIPTIGRGSTVYQDGSKVTMIDKAITQQEADELLEWHITKEVLPALLCVKTMLNDYQNGALMSFIYNCGGQGFIDSGLYRLININPLDPAIQYAFMAWNKARVNGVLTAVKGLTYRRDWEWQIYNAKVPFDDNAIKYCELYRR
jgi:lysozyme